MVFYAKKCNFERIFQVMIDSVIIEYLKHNRRLVVPKLGAFLVKEPDGAVVFSELLRGDDGVLRGLIKARGVGDIEAAGVIDRFVFEVRHALDSGRKYEIGDFGTLQRGENGIISFRMSRPATSRVQNAAVAANRPDNVAQEATGALQQAPDTRVRPRNRKPRRTDMFLIVAVLIAIAAIAVMVYGYVRANREDGTTLKEMFIPETTTSDDPVTEPTEAADMLPEEGAAEK